ncbi:MAG TPA: twin-arginine translocation signal domain-containing protein [Pyrinomonadaceae bacterium]|jgi:hypothetical protein
MTITRRGFIRNLGAVAVAAVSLNSTSRIFGQASRTDELFAVPPESFSDPLNYLTRAHFEPFIDTFVRVETGEKRIRLKLVEALELKRAVNESRSYKGESFSLLFEDTGKFRLAQDVYQIEHADLGKFSLLLVPTGLKGIHYEAIINRLGR